MFRLINPISHLFSAQSAYEVAQATSAKPQPKPQPQFLPEDTVKLSSQSAGDVDHDGDSR